jgi:hypothetical protein
MLDWVVVNVIEVASEIVFVINHVLPVTWLPYTAPPFAPFAARYGVIASATRQPQLSEVLLEPTPPPREIGVTWRERPDRVQMVRQQYDCLRAKWPLLRTFPETFAQESSGPVIGEQWPTLVSHQRKEEHPAWNESPPIVWHAGKIQQDVACRHFQSEFL